MGSKFYDIPFRVRTADSDFICKDGEIEKAEGVEIQDSDGKYYEFLSEDTTPPYPEIEFAITRGVLEGWHINPDQFPTKELYASEPSMEYWTPLAAQLLTQFQAEALSRHLMVAPFYAIGAWKTKNGSYLSPSQPVLMIPNSDIPLVATDGDIKSTELELKIPAALGKLHFKIKAPEILRDWVGKIVSLEIMASEPLHRYDTFSAFLPSKRAVTDNYCECLDFSTGKISQERICTQTLALAWKGILKNNPSNEGTKLKYYPFASIPLSEIDLKTDWSVIKEQEFTANTDGADFSALKQGNIGIKAEPIEIYGFGSEIDILTRPLKLSFAGELKLIRKFYLRGNYRPENLTISVYAGRDMLNWWKISERKGTTVVALPVAPFRFYKIRVKGILNRGESLQGLSTLL